MFVSHRSLLLFSMSSFLWSWLFFNDYISIHFLARDWVRVDGTNRNAKAARPIARSSVPLLPTGNGANAAIPRPNAPSNVAVPRRPHAVAPDAAIHGTAVDAGVQSGTPVTVGSPRRTGGAAVALARTTVARPNGRAAIGDLPFRDAHGRRLLRRRPWWSRWRRRRWFERPARAAVAGLRRRLSVAVLSRARPAAARRPRAVLLMWESKSESKPSCLNRKTGGKFATKSQ